MNPLLAIALVLAVSAVACGDDAGSQGSAPAQPSFVAGDIPITDATLSPDRSRLVLRYETNAESTLDHIEIDDSGEFVVAIVGEVPGEGAFGSVGLAGCVSAAVEPAEAPDSIVDRATGDELIVEEARANEPCEELPVR